MANRLPRRNIVALAVLLAFASPAWSQSPPPRVGYVFPAGGRRGTTFEVKLGGVALDAAGTLKISGGGVEGKLIGHTKPLTPKELNDLREKLAELQKKNPKSMADTDEIKEIQAKLAKAAIRPTPALAETATAEITIAADAPLGPRELRLSTAAGVSNPVVFDVGQLPEMSQAKELFDPEASARRGLARFASVKEKPRTTEVTVTLPAVLNSQILAGEVDRYRFPARQGQQLVFITRARALTPYLADAVPGWFQATLALYDADGNEVAYNDDFHNQPDPVLAYRVPADGEYVLEIKDALYRGREDFVYRIEAGELPFVTGIFPLGGKAWTRTSVALEGWNLPERSRPLEPRDLKPGALSLSVRNGDLESNHVAFPVNSLPECLDREPNNAAETAQPITLPIIVNGRIDGPGDRDVFRFEGRAGQSVVAEVLARRLDSPLDSVLKLTDADGKVVAYDDDRDDKGQGLRTHHADSRILVTLPKDGTYFLHLTDAQGHGGSAYGYRLRVSAPKPDFELRVTPSTINVRPNSIVILTVYALRKDGFTQDIELFLTDSPTDFRLDGAKVPANQDEVRLTLQVPSTVRDKPVRLALEGRAMIQGQRVSRLAVPAEDMMQAFAYHHLVPAHDMLVSVTGRPRGRYTPRLLEKGPVKLPSGGTSQVRFAMPFGQIASKVELVLNDPPDGITIKKAVVTAEGATLEIQADAEKIKPGLKANLIIDAYQELAKKPAGAARTPRFALCTLPPVPFEIVKPARADAKRQPPH